MMHHLSKHFFQHITDSALFQSDGYNLSKLFYNKYLATNTSKSGWQDNRKSKLIKIWLSFWDSLTFLSKLAHFKKSTENNPRYFFYGSHGRYIEVDQVIYDLYNANIIDSLGRNNVLIAQGKKEKYSKKHPPNLNTNGLHFLSAILRRLLYIYPCTDNFSRFGKKLNKAIPELNITSRQAIQIATAFKAQFLLYGFVLDILKPEQAIVICYYGKEAFIAACKIRGITVTELMHGTITPSHPHYNFSSEFRSFIDDRLLPDRLLVYGQYWREVVISGNFLPPSQIEVVGYYLKVMSTQKPVFATKKQVILITGQPTVQKVLIKYITYLKETLNPTDWQIIIKPHPNEDPTGYHNLQQSAFVDVTTESIYKLLELTNIHIGVYSTVVFEAARYQLANYTLLVEPYLTHCKEIVDSGVAQPLYTNQVPKPYQSTTQNISYYFAPYNPSVLY